VTNVLSIADTPEITESLQLFDEKSGMKQLSHEIQGLSENGCSFFRDEDEENTQDRKREGILPQRNDCSSTVAESSYGIFFCYTT
jgi:hypothetical protein